MAPTPERSGSVTGQRNRLTQQAWLEPIAKVTNGVSAHSSRASRQILSALKSRSRMAQGLDASYRSIVERAIAGIFQTTPDGRYRSANRVLARLYGYESAADLVMALTDVGHQLYVNPDDRETFVRVMAESGHIDRFESQVRRRDGEILWIRESARSVYDDDGELLYYEGFVEDITELKGAEQALQRSEEQLQQCQEQLHATQAALVETERLSSLGSMLAGIAHDLNNPVGFVRGNLDPMAQYATDLLGLIELYQKHMPEPSPEIAAEIEAIDLEFISQDLPKTLRSMEVGLDRIYRTIAALRSVSRADDHEARAINLNQVLDHTLTILASRFKGRGQRPDVTVTRSLVLLPSVTCYPCDLERALMNLLGNALDAIEEAADGDRYDGAVTPMLQVSALVVSGEQARCGVPSVQISISDNGIGIEPAVRDRIFESFFTTKPVGKGTGLGLAIAKEAIVDRHGGVLWLESTLGCGTTFHLEIPQTPIPQAP